MCVQQKLRSACASAQSDQSSLSAWRNSGLLAMHRAPSEDSDQPAHPRRLIWVFAWRMRSKVRFLTLWPILRSGPHQSKLRNVHRTMYLLPCTYRAFFICASSWEKVPSVHKRTENARIYHQSRHQYHFCQTSISLTFYCILWFFKQEAKSLIRLRTCAVWLGPSLSAYV